jgi:ubiquinone/menaquinone biosynthesis C-methylase UbiE
MTVLDIGSGMGVFTLALAGMVGPAGRVIAADISQPALDVLERRAWRAGLAGRVRTRCVAAGDLGLSDLGGSVDFALAFWMLHEAPDAAATLTEVRAALRPGGRLFVAEPIVHVSPVTMAEEVAAAEAAGFELLERPPVRFSRAAVFEAT